MDRLLSWLLRRPSAATVEADRLDLAAYLERRIGNHERIAASDTADDDSRARAKACAVEARIILGDVIAGMHQGEAAVAARIREKGKADGDSQ